MKHSGVWYMTTFEIQKAVLISLSSYSDKDAPKEELWQVVARIRVQRPDAVKRLNKFREWNKGKGLTYRLVIVLGD